jgi:tRNA-dihydrouridine synthase 1
VVSCRSIYFGRVQADCDVVDLNLDWNQAKAEKGPFGAALQPTWDTAVAIVAGAAAELDVPVSCKMRLFPTVEESVARALELEQAGCSMLVVHGRTREAKRTVTGVANWDAISAIKRALSIPVVANGSVAHLDDARDCLDKTGADGVMLGAALLNNPHALLGVNNSVVDVARQRVSHSPRITRPSLCSNHAVAVGALGRCVSQCFGGLFCSQLQ